MEATRDEPTRDEPTRDEPTTVPENQQLQEESTPAEVKDIPPPTLAAPVIQTDPQKENTILDNKQVSSGQISLIEPVPSQANFEQMEKYLLEQIDRCLYYKGVFTLQENTTLASKFETLYNLTKNDVEIVRSAWRDHMSLPRYAFEIINMTCVPTNTNIQDKELQVSIKVTGLPVTDHLAVYCIGEFVFPIENKDETIGESLGRWSRYVKIEPNRLLGCCCSSDKQQAQRQLDIVYSAVDKPFYEPVESRQIYFDRPMSFFLEKGRSRTLKRKFMPIKLTFYERTNIFRRDKVIGFVQMRIDDINDDATVMQQLTVTSGRKQIEALVDARCRVRHPLVDKSMRNHQEKILVLTWEVVMGLNILGVDILLQ